MKERNPDAPPKMVMVKNGISLFKDGITALKDLALILLLLLILICPDAIRNILQKAGVKKIGDVELVQYNDALESTSATIRDLEKQNTTLDSLLKAVKPEVNDPKLKASIVSANKENSILKVNVKAVQKEVVKTLRANAPEVKKAQAVLDVGGGLGIVCGGYPTKTSAENAAKKLNEKMGFNAVKVYFRNDTYRCVALTDDRETAKEMLAGIRKYIAGAYQVTMDSWCPDGDLQGDYCECPK